MKSINDFETVELFANSTKDFSNHLGCDKFEIFQIVIRYDLTLYYTYCSSTRLVV